MTQPPFENAAPAEHAQSISSDVLEHVRQALVGLRFGTLSIIVQDGVVIQLDRTEKKRLRKADRV